MHSIKKPIRLFWWNEPYFMKKQRENYGDLLGKYLVEKISGRPVRFVNPRKWHLQDYFEPIYATAGSILAHVNKHCVVWGSGVIVQDQPVKPAKFLAVRGPKTRNCLLKQGHSVPEVYGDPGLLLPLYYSPNIDKKYTIGIIPHYNDYQSVVAEYASEARLCIIDLMTNDIESTTDEILACEYIVSSSLHGIIIAHAYGIPAVWTPFSDRPFGDGIKFQDYFASVNLQYPEEFNFKSKTINEWANLLNEAPFALPEPAVVKQRQRDLLDTFPLKIQP